MTLWTGTACSEKHGSRCPFNDLSFLKDFQLIHFQTRATVPISRPLLIILPYPHNSILKHSFYFPSAEQQPCVLGGGPQTPTTYSAVGRGQRRGAALCGNAARHLWQVCLCLSFCLIRLMLKLDVFVFRPVPVCFNQTRRPY